MTETRDTITAIGNAYCRYSAGEIAWARLEPAILAPVSVLYPIVPVSGIMPVLLPSTYRYYREIDYHCVYVYVYPCQAMSLVHLLLTCSVLFREDRYSSPRKLEICEGGKFLDTTDSKPHRASNLASTTDQPRRVYSLFLCACFCVFDSSQVEHTDQTFPRFVTKTPPYMRHPPLPLHKQRPRFGTAHMIPH